jgi:phage terminase small subunit
LDAITRASTQGKVTMPSPPEIEAFCCAYVSNGNATQAYIDAVPCAATWKRRSASRKAVGLMKQPNVIARIRSLQKLLRKTSDAAFKVHLEEYFRSGHEAAM